MDSLFVQFPRSAATPAASIVSTSTGVLSPFSIFCTIPPLLFIHFVGQSRGFVIASGTSFPASRDSNANLREGDPGTDVNELLGRRQLHLLRVVNDRDPL